MKNKRIVHVSNIMSKRHVNIMSKRFFSNTGKTGNVPARRPSFGDDINVTYM